MSFQSVAKLAVGNRALFPLGTSGLAFQASGTTPSTKGGSGKAGHTEGVAGAGFPQLSIYMGA